MIMKKFFSITILFKMQKNCKFTGLSGKIPILKWFGIILFLVTMTGCEDFLFPNQELVREKEEMYRNWEDYRSAEMGLYALQQNLMEQIIVLGEVRGDLLKLTDNATTELIEVHNFNIRKDNPYASPVNFYKLIAACNKLIHRLKSAHPNVLDKSQPNNNYDRLFGEVMCMRAWAYFNAIRIYGKVPYIHESLNSVEEIENYVNAGAQYVDSVYIDYAADGFNNDTIRDTTIVMEKRFLNQKAVIDTFTYQLENNIKTVGVNHYINNNDITWQATVWNEYSRHALLGHMYLSDGNYSKAIEHFDPILYNYTSETNDIRFGLDDRFANTNWKNIFTGIDTYEHIYTLWFGKSYEQTNNIQSMFSILPPNDYMLKPTASCIRYWESQWNNVNIFLDLSEPENTYVGRPGIPGDFYRGYGVSYKYYKDGEALSNDTIQSMLIDKSKGNFVDVNTLMDQVDTVVTKYSIGKNETARDAHFIIYRAADIHLYAAEIYARWTFYSGGLLRPEINTGLKFINDGSYAFRDQLGVRGRVGFADRFESIQVENINYIHDPVTNEIIGYHDYTGNLLKKQEYFEDKILEERARELAFEGKRFFDIMRIAKRRNDPSYLANKIANKFSGIKKKEIYEKLMNEENWYVTFY